MSGAARQIEVVRLDCADCAMPLTPYRQIMQVEGATQRVQLLCEGCGRGIVLHVGRIEGMMWSERDDREP